ncbi:MAG: glycine/betaine ABC transporter substrate-binding protein [Anaerolineae bacterium]|nr:glycine/betaine ABC transporter substrate-binding protein [Anaerolineae bacterium]
MDNKNPVKRVWRILIWVAVVALMAACGADQKGVTPDNPVIKLGVNPWVASEANAVVAKIILEEEMGYGVEIVPIDEYDEWDLLAKGDLFACLEVWPSGHAENVQKYIQEEQSVEDGGFLGPVGKIAWYIPSYLLREHPELSTWQGFQDPNNAALFAADETGRGQFLAGDPGWVEYDEEIIRNLGLNLEVVRVGSEEGLLARLEEAYGQQKPILLYLWTPHWAHSVYDLVPVELPPYSDDCYAQKDQGGVACDYPADLLFKVFWSGAKDYAPDAYQFLRNFNYTNLDQIAILAAIQLDGKTVDEAAREWVEENETVWQGWIP